MKRPAVMIVEADPAMARRRRAEVAVIRGRVSDALAPVLQDVSDRRTLGDLVISAGAKIVADAKDAAAAHSSLGRAAGIAEPFTPMRLRGGRR